MREIQGKRDTGCEGYRGEGYRVRGIQGKRYTGLEGYRGKGIQGERDTG